MRKVGDNVLAYALHPAVMDGDTGVIQALSENGKLSIMRDYRHPQHEDIFSDENVLDLRIGRFIAHTGVCGNFKWKYEATIDRKSRIRRLKVSAYQAGTHRRVLHEVYP